MVWVVNFCPVLLLLYMAQGLAPLSDLSSQKQSCTLLYSTSPEVGSISTNHKAPQLEIDRRRNLAIISHPDSGKTTMTEKLLLYGGAIQQAGAVRQKAEQRATASDFMEMEKERGISISSTVMNFDYSGLRVNILDTPGHQDFSEDTYRALAAADNAVMLLDGAKGLEPQTRKLFEVCRMRKLPLFTFVNKLDRPAMSPYEIMDQIQEEFNLESHPILWPIGDGDRFKGVLDRQNNVVHLYQKPAEVSSSVSRRSCEMSIGAHCCDFYRLKEGRKGRSDRASVGRN
jgi:peptide chain release factor 3